MLTRSVTPPSHNDAGVSALRVTKSPPALALIRPEAVWLRPCTLRTHSVGIVLRDELARSGSASQIMSGDWYQQQNGRRACPAPNPQSRNAVDAVQDAHSLMAHYPFASATPASHGMST